MPPDSQWGSVLRNLSWVEAGRELLRAAHLPDTRTEPGRRRGAAEHEIRSRCGAHAGARVDPRGRGRAGAQQHRSGTLSGCFPVLQFSAVCAVGTDVLGVSCSESAEFRESVHLGLLKNLGCFTCYFRSAAFCPPWGLREQSPHLLLFRSLRLHPPTRSLTLAQTGWFLFACRQVH